MCVSFVLRIVRFVPMGSAVKNASWAIIVTIMEQCVWSVGLKIVKYVIIAQCV